MSYYIRVIAKTGETLRDYEPRDTLEDILRLISREYLADADHPLRYSGFMSIRSGEITHMMIKAGTAGQWIRDDIEQIDVYSERGKLEIEFFGKQETFNA